MVSADKTARAHKEARILNTSLGLDILMGNTTNSPFEHIKNTDKIQSVKYNKSIISDPINFVIGDKKSNVGIVSSNKLKQPNTGGF